MDDEVQFEELCQRCGAPLVAGPGGGWWVDARAGDAHLAEANAE